MVSEVIGEMLKLSIVVMLASVIAASVYGLIPEERVPYIEIEVDKPITNYNETMFNITHAGGDPVDSIEIIINNITERDTTYKGPWRFPDTKNITTNITRPFEVSAVHTRAVLARVKVE